MKKKTLILGATPNAERVAYDAAQRLRHQGHPIIPVGIKRGEICGQPIQNDKTPHTDVDTLTLYIGPRHQPEWYDFILETSPKRIIFNPGTENAELEAKAQAAGIETENACTLVLLATGSY